MNEEQPRNTPVVFQDPGLADIHSLAYTFVHSGWFKDTRAISQAITKILMGRELGFPPIASMQGVYIVDGKPSLGANLIAAAIKRTGKYNYRIREHTNQCCRLEMFEDGESVGFSEYTMADAATAGLATKGPWKAHPRNMLFARAISNGARWYCPEVFEGNAVYTPEELGVDETIDATGASILVEPVTREPWTEDAAPEDDGRDPDPDDEPVV